MQETTYKGHLIKYHCSGDKWVAVVWGPEAHLAAGGQVVTGRVDEGPEVLLRRVRARIDREAANGAAKMMADSTVVRSLTGASVLVRG